MSIKASEARSIIRKAKRRVPEGESVSHLNLTAMMDMMTILLVFMIMNMTTETSAATITAALPQSATSTEQEEKAVEVVLDKTGIVVDGYPVAKIVNGDVDAKYKQGNDATGMVITPLLERLGQRHDYMAQIYEKRHEKPKHEMTLIVDKSIPYRLLYSVMYTAGQAKGNRSDVGYQKIRMMVVRPQQ